MFQVQKQLQMRIEAQGKYLQKIIEEQQKLGGALEASDTVPLAEDKQQPSQSEPSPDNSLGRPSPRKKLRVNEGSTDESCPLLSQKSFEKQDLANSWDRKLYGSDIGFGFDLGLEFKEQEDGNPEQRALTD